MKLKCNNQKDDEIVLIDEEDYDYCSNYRWNILRQNRDGYTLRYVVRYIYYPEDRTKHGLSYLHRDIMKPTGKMEVDHINGNGLDNRKTNLRVVTHRINQLNRTRGRTPFGRRQYKNKA